VAEPQQRRQVLQGVKGLCATNPKATHTPSAMLAACSCSCIAARLTQVVTSDKSPQFQQKLGSYLNIQGFDIVVLRSRMFQ